MLGLNQMRRFIYLSVFLVGFSVSSVVWGGAEISGHFGMNFGATLNLAEITTAGSNLPDQETSPVQLGVDFLYRQMSSDTGSFGLGIRYRLAFTDEKDFEGTTAETDKYKFTHHRVALLANYRFYIDQFFVGPVLGLDIWKSLKFSLINAGNSNNRNFELNSSQFLWNNLTTHFGLEIGYQVTDNLLVKLEGGYDMLSFGFSGNEFCKTAVGDNDLESCDSSSNPIAMENAGAENAKSRGKLNLNAIYLTFGIGWFFG